MKKKLKILTVLGARPQFIKSKSLSDLLRKHHHFKEIIVHTGQHYDFSMYDIFLKELNLPKPDYFLGVNKGDNLIQVSRMLNRLKEVIEKEKPNLVIVYGDTNSTLAGALSAKEKKVLLSHIEAGLRSFRLDMAEELNRIITDRISDLLFAPVKEAVSNLKKEGVTTGVYLVGDVLYDVLLKFKDYIDREFIKLKKEFNIQKNTFLLLTLHRAETVDNAFSLKLILEAINNLNLKVIFPIHPRTQKRIKEFRLDRLLKKIYCVNPQSYMQTLSLIKNAYAVLTDSGGVQREAYMLKTPCITLRNETEWNQTLEFGWNRLVKVERNSMMNLPEILKNIPLPKKYVYIFGKGDASIKILKKIEEFILK